MRRATILFTIWILIASPGCARRPTAVPMPQPRLKAAPPPIVEPILLEEGP